MSTETPVTPWFKQGWPWFLISLPATAVVAGMITLWLALNSQHAMVVDDYYKYGKTINQRIARDAQATAFGLQGQLRASGERLQLTLTADSAVNPQWPDTVTLRIVHPSDAKRDQLVQLQHLSQGQYAGSASVATGRWQIHIEDPQGVWRLVSPMAEFGPQAELRITHRKPER